MELRDAGTGAVGTAEYLSLHSTSTSVSVYYLDPINFHFILRKYPRNAWTFTATDQQNLKFAVSTIPALGHIYVSGRIPTTGDAAGHLSVQNSAESKAHGAGLEMPSPAARNTEYTVVFWTRRRQHRHQEGVSACGNY